MIFPETISPARPAPRDPASRTGPDPKAGHSDAARTAETARTARAKPAEVVLVCRKCAKRAGLSPKEARRLAKAALRTASDGGGGPKRKARIVETGCLGPCPKRLLAVATGASLAAGRVALLDPRADPPVALPDFGPNAALPAPAGAGPRGGARASARDRTPIPT